MGLHAMENSQMKGRDDVLEVNKVHKNGKDYVKIVSGQIKEEQDGHQLVSACMEHDTYRVMLPADCLSEEFLLLSTRVAGLVLQKLINYNIKAVAVIDSEKMRGKFKEFLVEANRGTMFRAFEDMDRAEDWLLEGE